MGLPASREPADTTRGVAPTTRHEVANPCRLTLPSLGVAARFCDDGGMNRVIAALLAVSLAGCGLTMTRGPDPHRPPDRRPSCTESMDAPSRDALGAIAGLLAMVVGGLLLEGDRDEIGAPVLIGGAVLTVGAYASGGIGYYRVKKCQRAVSGFDRSHPT